MAKKPYPPHCPACGSKRVLPLYPADALPPFTMYEFVWCCMQCGFEWDMEEDE